MDLMAIVAPLACLLLLWLISMLLPVVALMWV